jgi:hypothetical protein
LATDGLAGVTAIDCNVAAATVSTVDPLMAPDVALIAEDPVAKVVAKPVALMVATDGVAELHITLAVRFCVLLSLNVPVAVNCWVNPLATDRLAGVTAIDCSVAALTVRTVDPATLPDVALMDEVPTAKALARPVPLIVATPGAAEAQVTLPVRFCVLLSVNVPMAVNCCERPLATDGLAGVTAID